MVEIIKRSIWGIAPLLLLFVSVARGESQYSKLASRNAEIQSQVDSLSQLIQSKRTQLTSAGDERSEVEREIVKMELELFDLNNTHNNLTDKLIALEQSGKASENSAISAKSSALTVRQISAVPLLKQSLPSEDFENLQYAEEDEAECSTLFAQYITSYNSLRKLKQLYDQAPNESEAIKVEQQFTHMMQSADSLSSLLGDMWSEIYDNKSFAYLMAMELIEDESLIKQQTQLNQASALKVEEVEHGEQSLAALKYDYQKRELITIEMELAKRLNLPQMIDSLQSVSKALEATPAAMDLSDISFTQRNFITYEPIKFVSATPYNTTTKKIPMAEEYQQGVIYRLQLGAYKYEQVPTIFRGTIPLSKDRALGFWTYYAGGFETLKEANEAAKLLVRRGFKRPEIVRWMDGTRRNLYRNPLPKETKYRIVISGTGQLPQEIKSKLKANYPDAILTQTGANRFIVSPITGEESVEQLIAYIKEINSDLNTSFTQITQ